MPIDYEIEAGILVIRLHGFVSTPEFLGYLAASADDTRYRSDLPRLIVIADDATFPPSQEIVAGAGKPPSRKLPPNVRFAAVAKTPLTIGITSMFMGNAGLGENYQVFDSEAKARLWLVGS